MTQQDEGKPGPPHSKPRQATPRLCATNRARKRRRTINAFLKTARGKVVAFLTFVAVVLGIVNQVVGLLPKHPSPRAEFDRVSVDTEVSLEEYEARYGEQAVARVAGPHPRESAALARTYRLLAATSAQAVTDPPSTTGGSSSSTTESRSSTPAVKSTANTTGLTETTSTFTKAPSSSTASHMVGKALARDGTGASPTKVKATVKTLSRVSIPAGESSRHEATKVMLPGACASSSCAVTPLIDRALTDDPDPAKAARAVLAIFADSRGRTIAHKLHPVGVAVNYKIDLSGFTHNEAILKWSLWSRSATRALPKSWLRNVIAKEIKPQGGDETFSGHFWIPVPPWRGDYVVHLMLYDNNRIERDETETAPPFH